MVIWLSSRPLAGLWLSTYFLVLNPVAMSECWLFSEAMLKNFKKTYELFCSNFWATPWSINSSLTNQKTEPKRSTCGLFTGLCFE